jgi:hypothetical protein
MALITFSFVSLDISIDENSPYWDCAAVIADYSQFESINEGDSFNVSISGEIWTFIIVSKKEDRNSPAIPNFTITGRSDTCLLDPPYKLPLIYVMQEDSSAKEVVSALLEHRPVTWLLKDSVGAELDWTLDMFSIAESGSSRLDCAKKIVEAAGGVLECEPDGTVVVRPLFSISPWQYDTIVADHSFTDVENLLNLSFDYTLESFYDWVRVRNVDHSTIYAPTDKIEMIFNLTDDGTNFIESRSENLHGWLRVYPFPYRNMEVKTTGSLAVVKIDFATKKEEYRVVPREFIEIIKGAGNTQFPIYDILEFRWQAEDLGPLTFNPYTTVLFSTKATPGYSTVMVTYRTRCYKWAVIATMPELFSKYETQILLVDPSAIK